VLGPDCGTAILNGVGLGFANRVRRGGVGLIGASGTGLQAVTVKIHALGAGVSQAFGTGGRDFTSAVGAITARQCLDFLAHDPETQVIVLVSKPPDIGVAGQFLNAARSVHKPIVVNFLGYPPPARKTGNLHFATNLLEAAELAVSLARDIENGPISAAESDIDRGKIQGYLRGLFSGGTLAYEALLGLRTTLLPLYANLDVPGVQRLSDPNQSQGHTIIDLGADEYTVGRLHPMIDPEARLRRLLQEAADPEAGAILIDVVLGEGSHPDPAAELASAIHAVRQDRNIEAVLILIGTDEDSQDLASQTRRLTEAGATVFHQTSEALAYLSERLVNLPEWPYPPVTIGSSETSLAAINVGLETFYQSLYNQGAQALQVDWRPPAGGDERLMSILAKMKGQRQELSG
jgi:FdrA protein